MFPRRKKPFSGKQKKEQLIQKRQSRGGTKFMRKMVEHDEDETTEDAEKPRKLMEQTRPGGQRNLNRYNLIFYQETRKELEQMRKNSMNALRAVEPKEREIDDHYFRGFDFPTRPPWLPDMDKATLDRNENREFRQYVELVQLQQSAQQGLSLFELNLETWRQLWRVLEFSDILLIVVDVRFSTLMFPPSLYDYIINEMQKRAILVLNKVDLVLPEVVVAWRAYFKAKYEQLPVVMFASRPARPVGGSLTGRAAHKRSMEGIYSIYKECQKIVPADIELAAWEKKILDDMAAENIYFDDEPEKQHADDNCDDAAAAAIGSSNTVNMSTNVFDNKEQQLIKYRDGILTIGCIGFPNVGKSSLINALNGRKVVSVSRTPGHTKHFQTIFLTNNVRLCDCPGLVFPSSTPKHLQVLIGSFPISQLQLPYPALGFLAEHLNLPTLLKMQLSPDHEQWSALAVADSWALKRGFLTAKAARPDRYRAANHLLRLALAGQNGLILQFYPPGYNDNKETWENHADVEEVKRYQNAETEHEENTDIHSESSANSDDSGSEEQSSSYDETNADEEDEDPKSTKKTTNLFDLLGSDDD